MQNCKNIELQSCMINPKFSNPCVGYTSEPVLKAFRKLSGLIQDQLKWGSLIFYNFHGHLNFRPPDAPKLALDRKKSPSAEDYLDFESPKPAKDLENVKKENRSGSFDDVLAELAKRQAKLQKYWISKPHDKTEIDLVFDLKCIENVITQSFEADHGWKMTWWKNAISRFLSKIDESISTFAIWSSIYHLCLRSSFSMDSVARTI